MIIDKLRERLVPKGTEPLVCLNFNGYGAHFDYDLVQRAITELETIINSGFSFNGKLSPLQQIAVHLLLDSAYIDLKEKE